MNLTGNSPCPDCHLLVEFGYMGRHMEHCPAKAPKTPDRLPFTIEPGARIVTLAQWGLNVEGQVSPDKHVFSSAQEASDALDNIPEGVEAELFVRTMTTIVGPWQPAEPGEEYNYG